MNRKTRKTLAGAVLAVGLIITGPHARVLAAPGGAHNVTVNFANTDIVDVLKALATQTGSNIVAGPEAKDKMVSVSMKNVDLNTALDMVTRLNGLAYQDVDGTYVVASPTHLKEMYPGASETSVYTLTSLKPTDAVTTLSKMVPSLLAQAQGTSLVTLTGSADEVKQGRELLARMEGASATSQGERETVVYELKFLNVIDAKRLLTGLMPDLLITPGPARRLPGSGKVGSTANGTSEVNMDVTQVTSTATVTTPGAGAETSAAAITLNPGEEANTLLLTGYPDAIAKAKELLNSVDTAPRQVEITARVVDLRDDDALKLGLKYTPSTLSISEGADSNGAAASSVGRLLSFGQFSRTPFGIGVAPDFQSVLTHSKTLANPRIAAVDGRAARIFIGDTITYVVSQTSNQQTNVATYVTEKLHVGITLLSTPHISPDGTISLEVHPTVSSLSSLQTVGGVTLPTVSERSVDTTIQVHDGETVAIGGLLREDDVKTMTSVPFISKIPFFGELFKHRSNETTHSDVTIFITTKIVNQ
jgi:type II secretory pathway component GspD/PulD (secretin)